MSWYKIGTVNVTKNSNIVTGVGTKWTNQLSGVSSGRMLILQISNQIDIYEIESVQSDTQLTLSDNYLGETIKGLKYTIPTSPSVSIEQFALEIASSLAYHQKQLDGWQKILTESGDVTLTAPDGQKVTIKSQKSLSSAIDNAVKKSGDTMTGQLVLPKNGLKINYDNKNIMALITAEDNYSHVFYDAEKKQWLSKLVYNSTINSWSFQYINDVVINGKSVLKTGDAIQTFGDLSTTINLNELTGSNEGIYYQAHNASAVAERGYPIGEAGTLQVFKNGADGAGCCQIYTTYRNARQFIRNYRGGTKTWEEWNEIITTANSKSFIKTGDYGIGALTGPKIDNPDETLKGGCYATRTTAFPRLTEYQNRDDSASLIVYPAWTKNWYVEKLAVVYSKTPRIYYRCSTPDGKQPFYEVITTANASADIVSALPATKSVVNGVPTYTVGGNVEFEKIPTVNGRPALADLTDVNNKIELITAKLSAVGDFRLMPFRANELPFGWYFRNGDNYLLSSPQGKALNGLSDNYKRDHQITIKNINGQQYINVPSAFAPDGRGFFERAVNGTTRQVGTVESDAIRNITGNFDNVLTSISDSTTGAFYRRSTHNKYNISKIGDGNGGELVSGDNFDASRVVPTAHENRPINIGMTPVIYLGV